MVPATQPGMIAPDATATQLRKWQPPNATTEQKAKDWQNEPAKAHRGKKISRRKAKAKERWQRHVETCLGGKTGYQERLTAHGTLALLANV